MGEVTEAAGPALGTAGGGSHRLDYQAEGAEPLPDQSSPETTLPPPSTQLPGPAWGSRKPNLPVLSASQPLYPSYPQAPTGALGCLCVWLSLSPQA